MPSVLGGWSIADKHRKDTASLQFNDYKFQKNEWSFVSNEGKKAPQVLALLTTCNLKNKKYK